jgi:hypothetical protein
MSVVIEATTRSGEVQRTAATEGTVRIQARPGVSYRLAAESGASVPGQQVAKRIGDDLVIEGLPGGQKVVLEDFYTACADGDSCSMNFAGQGDAPPTVLLPDSAPLATLADGTMLMYGAGTWSTNAAVAAGTAAAAAAAGSSILTPALAAIGGLAIAAGGGGGGGDGGSANNDPAEPPADTTAPTPPAVDASQPTSDNTPTITGTAEPGSTVEIMLDGVAVGSVTAGPDGRWSFTPAAPLADGRYDVTATATDAAGNRSDVSPASPLEVDTTAPAEPTVDASGPTNDTTPTLSGTATLGDGEVLSVTVNGTTYFVGDHLTIDGGVWTLTLPEGDALAEGDYTVVATVTDAAGNASSASGEVRIDLTAPDVPEVAAIGLTNNPTPTIAGTAEPGSTVEVFVDGESVGTTTADDNGDWFLTPANPIGSGDRSITATATDAAGNTSEPSTPQSASFDFDAPEVPTVDPLGNTNVNPPTITGTADAGSRVTVYADGEPIGETIANEFGVWSFTPDEPMADGQYSITATATDEAGNTSELSTQKSLVIDTDAPDAPTVDPLLTNVTTPVITGTASVGDGETLSVTVNGTTYLVGAHLVLDGTNWTLTLPGDAALPEGEYPVVATVSDAAGNDSSGSAALVIDLTAPDAPVVNALTTKDLTPEITGTAALEEGDVLTVSVNGVDYTLGNGLSINPDGTWSVQTGLLGVGTWEVLASVTDAAGNVSVDASSGELVIDSPVSSTVIWDNVGQYKGVVASGSFTDDKTPELRLSLDSVLESGQTLQIYRQIDGGESQLVATLSGNPTQAGYYSFTDDLKPFLNPGNPGEVGTFTYNAAVVDSGGTSVDLALNYTILYDLAN